MSIKTIQGWKPKVEAGQKARKWLYEYEARCEGVPEDLTPCGSSCRVRAYTMGGARMQFSQLGWRLPELRGKGTFCPRCAKSIFGVAAAEGERQ